MSDYTAFIAEPNSTKNILVEVDIGLIQTTWFSYEPNIWQWDVTTFAEGTVFSFGFGSFGYGSFGFGGTANTGEEAEIFNIGSVIVNGVQYTSVSTLATLRSTESTFKYDISTQLMLIHFEDDKNPDQFNGAIKLGVVNGFASQLPGIYNSTEYKPRVLSVPSFTESVDPLVFGLISFNTGAIALENTDGDLDNWKDILPIGSEVRVLLGGNDLEYSDYTIILTTRIKDFDMDERIVTVNVADVRESLSNPIPENLFNIAVYPFISDDNRNKQIPMRYGVLRNVEAFCTNEEESGPPTDYTFKLSDTTFHSILAITAVRVEGVDKTAQKTDDLADGSFTLPNAHYTAGDEVTVDMTGYTDGSVIDNALDVIKDILVNHTAVAFTSDFFNTTEWNAATALVKDISISIEDTDIIDVIEEVCNTVQGSFKIQSDGLYTFKLHNTAQGPQKTIAKEEFEQDIKVEYRDEEYVSSALIKYNRNWNNGKYRQALSDDDEFTQLVKYNKKKRRPFETLLTTEDNAITLGRAIVLRNKDIIPVFTIVTKIQNIDLSVFKTVNVVMDRQDKIWFGEVKCEVVGIKVDFDSFEVELTLRFVNDVVAPTIVDDSVEGLFYGEGETAVGITGFYGAGIFGGFYMDPSAEVA